LKFNLLSSRVGPVLYLQPKAAMPMLDLTAILDAVRLAAALTRRVQQLHIVGSEKVGHEPVTIADYGSQAILCRAISRAYPDDAVLAEERADQFMSLLSDADRTHITRLVGETLGESLSESDLVTWLEHGRDKEAERTWIIDPVDGTKGFIAMRRYALAIGALEGGLPIAGIIGSPGYNDGLLFHGQGSAAYMQRLSGGKTYRVAVSQPKKSIEKLYVVESVENSHADHEGLLKVLAAAGITSPVLERIDGQDKYAMVACGDADLYLRLPREANPRHKVWDHIAGTALVQAAGGVVTDLDGSPLDFSLGSILARNKGMVVSSGYVHERVLEALTHWELPQET
jgi:3'(2'), 5'-bisphosphate nucleotidase